MKWTRKGLRLFICSFLALLLALSVATCCSAEQTYKITEQELTKLETNLATLKSNNNRQKNELQSLLIQLNESKILQQQTATSLENANKYLEEYAKEVKAKESRIKRQRTFAYVLCFGLGYLLVAK